MALVARNKQTCIGSETPFVITWDTSYTPNGNKKLYLDFSQLKYNYSRCMEQ